MPQPPGILWVVAAVTAAVLATASAQGTSTSTVSGCSWKYGGQRTLLFSACQTLEGSFQLMFNYSAEGNSTTGPRIATIGVETTHTGWVGFGISPSRLMVGSQVVIGFPGVQSSSNVNDYFLREQSPAGVAPPSSLTVLSQEAAYVDRSTQLLFTLLIPSGLQAESIPTIWGKGPKDSSNGFTLSMHGGGDVYTGTVDLVTGTATTSPKDRTRDRHGILNAISWGLLMILGTYLPRHFKSFDPLWFYIHQLIQISAFALGTAGFALGIKLYKRLDTLNDHQQRHYILGIIVYAGGCLQLLAVVARPHKEAAFRWIWDLYHHWTGRAVLVLAVINIYFGFDLLKPGRGWVIAYTVALVVIILVGLILEAVRFMGLGYSGHQKLEKTTSALVDRKSLEKTSSGITDLRGHTRESKADQV